MQNHFAQELKRTVTALFPELTGEALFRRVIEAPAPALDTKERAANCTACALHIGRKNSVFGSGNLSSGIAFVGDSPSTFDDNTGNIFSDEAGKLLDRMITAMHLRPENTYKTNLVKCRSPNERAAKEAEINTCRNFLDEEINGARIIVALGESAAQFFSRTDATISALRGKWYEHNDAKVMITHHPRALLKDPAKKKEAWEDLQSVMKALAQ
jgi:uracil-DNA glycosylase family 4